MPAPSVVVVAAVVAAVVLPVVGHRLGLGHVEAHVEVPVGVDVLRVPLGEAPPWPRPRTRPCTSRLGLIAAR